MHLLHYSIIDFVLQKFATSCGFMPSLAAGKERVVVFRAEQTKEYETEEHEIKASYYKHVRLVGMVRGVGWRVRVRVES